MVMETEDVHILYGSLSLCLSLSFLSFLLVIPLPLIKSKEMEFAAEDG